MIYILYGKDNSMVSMKLEAIKKRHHIQENVNIYDAQADEISNVLQDLDAYSIFDDDKMSVPVGHGSGAQYKSPLQTCL